jgi:hypothetical protein
MSISQVEDSEKLTGLAFGPTYRKTPFSTLFEHVKDDAIHLDQTEHLLHVATHSSVHEIFIKAKEGHTEAVQDYSTGSSINSKVFIGQDGKQHFYLIAPEDLKRMTQTDCSAE